MAGWGCLRHHLFQTGEDSCLLQDLMTSHLRAANSAVFYSVMISTVLNSSLKHSCLPLQKVCKEFFILPWTKVLSIFICSVLQQRHRAIPLSSMRTAYTNIQFTLVKKCSKSFLFLWILVWLMLCLHYVGEAAWLGPSSPVKQRRNREKREDQGAGPRQDRRSLGEMARTMSSWQKRNR